MREVGIAIVAAIAIGGLLAPQGSESRARAHCAPPRSVEIARSKETRVYRERYGADRLVVACHYRTGRRRVLQSSEQGIYVYPPPAIGLRGELVAYAVEDQSDPVSPFLTSIGVMNVRTGRPASRYALADPPNTNAKVGSVAVSRRASVAWIACKFGGTSEAQPRPECTRPGSQTRVYRLPAGSEKPEMLAEGTAIDPRSLRLVGGNVKWKNGDEVQVAPMDGTAPAGAAERQSRGA
jgi:hypothetical protein